MDLDLKDCFGRENKTNQTSRMVLGKKKTDLDLWDFFESENTNLSLKLE